MAEKAFMGFTEDELHLAFDKVKDRTNWKEAIDAVIEEKDFEVVSAAIIFYTGSLVDSEEEAPGRLRVYASGYYANIGS